MSWIGFKISLHSKYVTRMRPLSSNVYDCQCHKLSYNYDWVLWKDTFLCMVVIAECTNQLDFFVLFLSFVMLSSKTNHGTGRSVEEVRILNKLSISFVGWYHPFFASPKPLHPHVKSLIILHFLRKQTFYIL